MREKIIEYLMEHFCTAYCCMCEHDKNPNDLTCDYCCRDESWALSRDAAENMAEDIIKIVHDCQLEESINMCMNAFESFFASRKVNSDQKKDN